jgi:acetyl esterase/lipase
MNAGTMFLTKENRRRPRHGYWAVLLLGGFVATSQAAPGDPVRGPVQSFDIAEHVDIRYQDGPDADPRRHTLDVLRPQGEGEFPVLLFVHGGAWSFGSKERVGLHSARAAGRALARKGLVVVMPNYRLSPRVRHPEHVRDVARALAWTHANIARHGGRPDQIFVCGHSAGGHLIALLTTDESYLKAVGLERGVIKGAIAISGVFRLASVGQELANALLIAGPAPDIENVLYNRVFGEDSETQKLASPLTHVCRGLPPFLVISADFDLPTLRSMATEFVAALQKEGCEAEGLKVPLTTHTGVVYDFLHGCQPRTCAAVVAFVHKHIGR